MIIHIDGVPGSGKSYLGSQISKWSNVAVVDTDDTVKEAIKMIEESQRTKNKQPRTVTQMKKIQKKIISAHIKNNDVIVFVGMTASIRADYRYFIKIEDPDQVYRRLLIRELDKIEARSVKIRNHIATEPDPKEIDVMRIADLSLVFPVTYEDFLADYRERLARAKQQGITVSTQAQIIAQVEKLLRM